MSTVAGVYGGNASGKSNLLSAVLFLVSAVEGSHSSWSPDGGVPIDPFKLDGEENPTSTYEIEFSLGAVRHQYGFEVDSERVLKEWLYAYPKVKRRTLFERDASETPEYYFGNSLAGRNQVVADLTRDNSLFLSAAAASKHEQLSPVAAFVRREIRFADASNYASRTTFTLNRLRNDKSLGSQIVRLLRVADLGICDIRIESRYLTEEERERLVRVLEAAGASKIDAKAIESLDIPSLELLHEARDGRRVGLPLEEESVGTRALVALVGPILDVLSRSSTLFIDEVDTSLHPRLVAELVRLFQNPLTNPNQSQLVFTSHDTSLLGNLLTDEPLLARDQVWLTEKDRSGASSIYPLSDFSPRRFENLERGYLQGRYGGVPLFGYDALSSALAFDGDR